MGVCLVVEESLELTLGPAERLRDHASPSDDDLIVALILGSKNEVLVVEGEIDVVWHFASESILEALVDDVRNKLVGNPRSMMVGKREEGVVHGDSIADCAAEEGHI